MIERPPAPMARWHGPVLVIGRAMDDAAAATLPEVPSDRDLLTVVVTAVPLPDVSTLLDLLANALPVGCAAIRLVLPGAGFRSSSTSAFAQLIADSLSLRVIAPDGPVLALPGALFVTGGGGWLTFRSGAAPVPEGPRQPAPQWQRDLAAIAPAEPPLRSEPVPGGWWLYSAADEPSEHDDPAFAVPVHPSLVALVIGRPGGRDPELEPLARYLRALPAAVRDKLLLVPYGPGGRIVDALAEQLVADADIAVQVATGMPGRQPDGSQLLVRVGADGRPTWRPYAQRLLCRRATVPQLLEWLPPIPGEPAVEPGVQHLDDTWRVEVLRCGLWVRDDHRDPVVPALPADPDRLLLVVGSPASPAGPAVWPAVQRLLGQLPGDARRRVQFVLPGLPLPGIPGAAAGMVAPPAASGYPPAWTLTADGRLLQPGDAAPVVRPAPAEPPQVAAELPPAPAEPPPAVTRVQTESDPPRPAPPAAAVSPPEPPAAPMPSEPPAAVHPRSSAPPTAPPSATGPSTTGTKATSAGALGPSATVAVPSVVPRPLAGAGPVVAVGHRSTDEERQRVRELLARRFDAHARVVTKLLAQRPGLRAAAAGQPPDAPLVDLVAVRAALVDDPSGEVGKAADRAFAACVTSGLARLPAYLGPVVRRPDPTGIPVVPYRPGQLFVLPSMLITVVAGGGSAGAEAELVIWSLTGRRVADLVDEDRRDVVVFAPGTRLAVLAVEPGVAVQPRVAVEPGGGRIWLRETTAHSPAQPPAGPDDATILQRLRRAVGETADGPVPAG